jgi:putative DNA primase/helicase
VYQQNGAPKITNPDGSTWDIDTWLSELTDDVETTKLLYQVIGAVIRPYVSWEKIIFLYSTVGRNGKGTFCALLRELVGDGNYTAMSIKQMTQKFAVSKLMDVIAVITDENSVNIEDVLSDASVLKAVTTHDHIQLERKYQNPVDFQFFGQIVQCINYLPQLKDITDSMKRRLLFVDFPKTFTGCDNKLIKSEYLHRKDVLEYILWEVLVKIPDYYEFDIPAASERLLHTYELRNDNVKDFWCDMSPQLVWNICPGGFLYDLYKAWIDRNEPRGTVMGRNAFYAHLRQIVLDDDDWYAATSSIPIPKNAVCPPEPLILKYNLTDWMCDDYKGGNVDVRCTPTLPSSISSAFICTGTTFEDVEEEEDDVPFRNDTTDSDSET